MNNKLFFIILFCVCFGVYAGYLNNGFVFDDLILVESNPLIKSVRLLPRVFSSGIYEYWTGPQGFDRMYRPLQMLSYYFDYHLWGVNPAGFRFTNLIIHWLNSILVFYLARKVFKHLGLACSTSLLFLVHPVQISTVAYISSRGDLLSAFFILSSCLLFVNFLNSSNYRLYLLSILASALAFLSRENAVLIICFLVLCSLAVNRKKLRLRDLSGFVILALVYLMARVIALGISGLKIHPAYTLGATGLVNFINIIFRYILLLIWPHDLRLFHTTDFVSQFTWIILGLIVVASGALVLAWRFRKDKLAAVHPCLKFGLAWFLLGLAPVAFYFDAYPALKKALMAESWLYLPSIGFFIAVSYWCLLIKQGKLIIIGAILALASLVMVNQAYWRNDVAFYERTLDYLPDDNIIQKNLASAYIREGDFIRAHKIIKKLERYYPDSPVLNSAWGQYYLAIGQPQAALGYYQRLLSKSFFTNYSMSLCYSKLGDLHQAIGFARVSFNLNQLYLPNLLHLAKLYQQVGQLKEAQQYFSLASQLDPKNKRLSN